MQKYWQRYWNLNDVVDYYAGRDDLLPAEQVILDNVKQLARAPAILDIGVGGGRTSAHLVPCASRYVGIDISPAMIAACEARADIPTGPNTTFRVADAKDLPFDDNSFDLVLFSFNGVDNLTHRPDRTRALQEMIRVCCPGGAIAFSAHNINHLSDHFSLRARARQFSLTPVSNLPHEIAVLAKAVGGKVVNPSGAKLRSARWAVVRDTYHRGRMLKMIYIRPDAQLEELAGLGVEGIEVLDNQGQSIPREALATVADSHPYYLMKKKAVAD